MKGKVSLSLEQKKTAQQLIKEVDQDSKPTDFISQWEPTPERYELDWENKGKLYVPVNDIIGTEPSNTNRLVPSRLISILEKMINDDFDKENQYPPVLAKIGGEYYVDSDGNHRVLAHKILGIEEIYAEVVEYN